MDFLTFERGDLAGNSRHLFARGESAAVKMLMVVQYNLRGAGIEAALHHLKAGFRMLLPFRFPAVLRGEAKIL